MPEIIAHRGVSRERLENSIPAFQRAVELGADGVELDVHVTLDGTVVVHHDPVVRGTSTAPELHGRAISTLTTAELATFRLSDDRPVPTLVEVAGLLRDALTIYCELKGPGTAGPSLDVLQAAGGQCAVHSFDHRMIAEAKHAAPAVPRGVLEVSRHVDPTASLRDVGARDLWQLAEYIDEAMIHQVHAVGGRVIAWTVNDAHLAERLTRWGVDGLCGDDVGMLRSVLGR